MGRGGKGNRLNSDQYVGESSDWYGDDSYYKEGETASWVDVLAYVFNRSCTEWLSLLAYTALFLALLYGYFFGITLLNSSAEVLSSCHISSLMFQRSMNPLTLALLGMITTNICQSSVATNVIISSLVGNVFSVQQCIFVAMGANFGNTIINSLLVLVHCRNKSDLERAIAGASVNDFYLFYAVLVLLPIEAMSGMLYHLSSALLPESLSVGYQWGGFVGSCISPLISKIIVSNKVLISAIVSGDVQSCNTNYPLSCEDGTRSYENCNTGIIGCDGDTNSCPFLFRESQTLQGDVGGGFISLAIAVGIISLSMAGILKLFYRMLIDTPVEVIATLTNINDYVLIVLGCGITLLLGSSSISEAIFNPALAYGIIESEKMFPWSLGSNLGMSLFMVIQALFSGSTSYLHIALANLFFNFFGTIIWYPLPCLRKFPLHSSLILGVITRKWRITALLHVGLWFFGFPYAMLGIIDLLSRDNLGLKSLGIVSLIVLGLCIIPTLVWWFFGSGKVKFVIFFDEEKDSYPNDEDSMSMSDSFSDESTIEGGSSVGGYEVKFKKKEKTTPKGILKNQDQVRRSKGRSVKKENSLTDVKPKPSKPHSRKRLKKSRRKNLSGVDCCGDVSGCGVVS